METDFNIIWKLAYLCNWVNHNYDSDIHHTSDEWQTSQTRPGHPRNKLLDQIHSDNNIPPADLWQRQN